MCATFAQQTAKTRHLFLPPNAKVILVRTAITHKCVAAELLTHFMVTEEVLNVLFIAVAIGFAIQRVLVEYIGHEAKSGSSHELKLRPPSRSSPFKTTNGFRHQPSNPKPSVHA